MSKYSQPISISRLTVGSLRSKTGLLRLDRCRRLGRGMYLVGRDITPGTYRGKAGTDVLSSCYWARLSGLSEDFDDLIANDNATGSYYVSVDASGLRPDDRVRAQIDRIETAQLPCPTSEVSSAIASLAVLSGTSLQGDRQPEAL